MNLTVRVWSIASCLIVLLAGLPGLVQAQVRALDPQKVPTQYLLDVWQVPEGLPQNTVEALLQTRDGYLWIGTQEGLARFDGLTFEVFEKNNTQAFEQSHFITDLAEDRHGTLWIGTRGNGVLSLRDYSISPHPDSALADLHVNALVVGPDGTLWIGTANAGLFACGLERCRIYTEAEGLPSRLIRTLRLDQQGTVWIGTDRGLVRLQNGRMQIYTEEDGLPNAFVMSLYASPSGRLWIGTRKGLARMQGGVIERCPPEDGWPEETVWAVLEDAAGSLWMGLDQSGVLRHREGRFDAFGVKEGLTHGRVINLLVDQEGSLWIGTEAGGLNHFRDGAFTTFTTADGLSSNMVLTVYEDIDGHLWTGTEDGGLNRLRRRGNRGSARLERRFAHAVSSIYGRGSELWVGTLGSGLHRHTAGRWTTYTTPDGFSSDAVYALHTSTSGDLWIGTDAGLVRYNGKRFEVFTTDQGLSSNFITAIHEDRRGTLWIGTYDGGLNRYQNGRFHVYDARDGLGSNIISALYEDADGALWIGTYGGGLVRFRNERFTRFTPRHGLFDDKIYQILEDDFGYLWMGCNKGVFRVRKASLHALADGSEDHVTSTVYDPDDGLLSREINGGVQPAGWKSQDGRLWFPTVRGLAVVDPATLGRNEVPPPVIIEAVRVEGRVLRPHEVTDIAPGTEHIEFKYTALSLVDPQAVRFRYQLEGYETKWSDLTDLRTARYTHLDPGKYTFRVIAMNRDHVWNEAGAAFSFRLLPFFWQTFWFWFLVGTGVTLIGVAGIRWRLRQLTLRRQHLEEEVRARTRDLQEAKDQIEQQAVALQGSLREKEVLLREIHHRVKNNLQIISSMLHLQAQKISDPPVVRLFKECRTRIYSMSMIHEQLYSAENLAQVDFGSYLQSITEEVFRSHNVHGNAVLHLKADAGSLDVDQAIPCGLIVNELVSNALKHAFPGGRTGWVEVTFASEPSLYRLIVEDNGVGMPDGYDVLKGSSLGLKLVHALTSKLRGQLHVSATRDAASGTRFALLFPVREHLAIPNDLRSTTHTPVN